MRRELLRSSLLVAGLGACSNAGAVARSGSQKFDRRLVGIWRSDRERTIALWKYTKEISEEKRQKFEAIFGKLTLRVTAQRWEVEYESQIWSSRYEVLASDMKSVVVLHHAEPGEKAEVKQYFFEEGYMNVASGYNFEFFRRVEA